MKANRKATLSCAVLIFASTSCFATTGIYITGYGTQEQGMGGTGIATGESALAPATNPAGISFSGDRLDIGGGLLFLQGGAEDNGVSYRVKTGIAPLPEFGYVRSISPSFVFGIASWTAGAMSNYPEAFGSVPGNSNTYSQAILTHIAPTLAFRFGPNYDNAVALSAVGALSTIRVDGVEAQTGLSNRGRDWSPGYGFRLGWMSRITPQLSVGAFYASPVYYQPWSAYSNILADGGRFEEPEQYGAGIAFRPTPAWLIAFDWVRFNYGKTKMLGNPLNFSVPFGSETGSGFGFTDINAYRFGVQYKINTRLTVRGGMELTNQVVTAANTALVYLAPATQNRTYTLGATYELNKQSELSFAYALSPRVTVAGTGLSAGVNPYGWTNYVALTYTRKL